MEDQIQVAIGDLLGDYDILAEFVAFRSRNTLHFTPVMRSERIRCLAWVVVRNEAAYPPPVRSAPSNGCYYSLRLPGRHAGRDACQASPRQVPGGLSISRLVRG